MRCLIVDDSEISRKVLRALLESLGHEIVGEAEDGQAAYVRYNELSPEFLTMDINMPKVDGIAASRNILRKNPDARIVLISADSDPKTDIFSDSRVRSIVKPIERAGLEQAIAEVSA